MSRKAAFIDLLGEFEGAPKSTALTIYRKELCIQLSSKHTAKGKLYSLAGKVTSLHVFSMAGATVEGNSTPVWTDSSILGRLDREDKEHPGL